MAASNGQRHNRQAGEAGPLPWDDFVHTGPDTLAGRYLRRFWQPVYLARDLQPGHAKPITIMSEEFTLYRGEGGVPHLVAFRCAHRGTQLSTGWVEGDCLRCFYHGWKYDAAGQCVEQPAEDASFAAKVRIGSYPTAEYLGLIFAYLGEGKPPALPRYSVLEQAGVLSTSSYVRQCNYWNNVESNMDELHVAFVHRDSEFSSQGLNRDLPQISGEETEYGIVKYGTRADGVVRVSLFFMPNVLYIKGSPDDGQSGWVEHVAWRVPLDDTRHRSFMVSLAHVTGDAARRYQETQEQRRAALVELPPTHEAAEAVLRGERRLDEFKDRPDIVGIQDAVAQAGQGVVVDREHERLGRSDVLVILLRKIYARELQALAEGRSLKQWRVPDGLIATSGV